MRPPVATGIDQIADGTATLRGGAVGVITNMTGVDRDFRPTGAVLRERGSDVRALFAPEHGISGAAQAGEGNAWRDPAMPDVPVYDTYGEKSRRGADGMIASIRQADVDHVVFDIQDVGARFWTYSSTMYDALIAAATLDIAITVLDRPNPIGGVISEGHPAPDRPWQGTFVGRAPIPARHGLSFGELATSFNDGPVRAQAGKPADLVVIELTGWQRDTYLDRVEGYPWVFPSPNLPTVETALVYPGLCLFEGTTLSEGRGTTRPFELIGAPYVDARLAPAAGERALPGVTFRPVSFTPTQSKHEGVLVHGVQVHVRDRDTFRPVLTALTLLDVLIELYGGEVTWRELAGRYSLDSLWGSDELRVLHAEGRPLAGAAREPTAPQSWATLRY
ncbi:MAG: exo-beta-N-acetylmuramidase NamZ family protein [Mycobacteriales bacterium]